jgi:hypothetical protein
MVNEVVNGLTICPSRVVVVNCPPFRGALTACHPPHRAFAPYADAMTNKPSRTARCPTIAIRVWCHGSPSPTREWFQARSFAVFRFHPFTFISP